jgi:hypothetical protein
VARTSGVRALGVDETSFLHASPTRRTRFVTGLVDLDCARLLDVVDGRAGSAVRQWLADRDEHWLSTVERVALDPYRGYYNALVGGLYGTRGRGRRVPRRQARQRSMKSAAACNTPRWASRPQRRPAVWHPPVAAARP